MATVELIAVILAAIGALSTAGLMLASVLLQIPYVERMPMSGTNEVLRLNGPNADAWQILSVTANKDFGIPDAFEPDELNSPVPTAHRQMKRYVLPLPAGRVDLSSSAGVPLRVCIRHRSSTLLRKSLAV